MSPAGSRRSIFSQSAIFSTLLLVFSLYSPTLACQAQDRDALRNIASAFGPNGILDSWTHTAECCTWPGALCDLKSGRVVSLQILGPSDLYGHLPNAIGALTALTIIKISGHPRLSGPIPPSLSQLPSLQVLDLSGNGFTGTIPRSLSQLNKLLSINLSNNHLTGTIPTFFGNISEAAPDLDLSNNRLSGNIPADLGKPNWRSIKLSNNQLTGNAKMLFGGAITTAEIHLQNNGLDFIFDQVTLPPNLVDLDLSHNRINGTIPDSILQTQLTALNLSFNRLCGRIQPLLVKFGVNAFIENKCLCDDPLPLCP